MHHLDVTKQADWLRLVFVASAIPTLLPITKLECASPFPSFLFLLCPSFRSHRVDVSQALLEAQTVYKLLITNQMSGCLVITSCHLPRHSLTTTSFLILMAQDVVRHGGALPKGPVETAR